MISSLIKSLMKDRGLTQRALAELMGVSLDRVKSLTSGKAQKLTREETEALVRKLHVRADWLATGEGPMRQPVLNQQTEQLLALVNVASEMAGRLPVSPEHKTLVQEVLFFAQSGNLEQLAATVERFAALAPDEAALLDNYRHSPKDRQGLLKATSAAFAQPPEVKKGRAA